MSLAPCHSAPVMHMSATAEFSIADELEDFEAESLEGASQLLGPCLRIFLTAQNSAARCVFRTHSSSNLDTSTWNWNVLQAPLQGEGCGSAVLPAAAAVQNYIENHLLGSANQTWATCDHSLMLWRSSSAKRQGELMGSD